MRILIFAHPLFLRSESMPRFARMLQEGLSEAGHSVSVLRPKPYVHRISGSTRVAKWASYFDQYLIFPFRIVLEDARAPSDTLFVFADQALGPWIPYVRRHTTVVHCHDLLALKSALGKIPENKTGWTGRLYQRYIRWGFRRCKNFISVSKRTADDLKAIGGVKPTISQVVFNPLNYNFQRVDTVAVQQLLAESTIDVVCDKYLLYVGGGQWYKNRRGLLSIYRKYASAVANPLPLVCVSPEPEEDLKAIIKTMPASARLIFLKGIDAKTLEALYSGARLMLFPSLAEGFGWPIIEAQACGCPVITTDDSPMNEIAGPVSRLLPLVSTYSNLEQWAEHGAGIVIEALSVTSEVIARERAASVEWADNFRIEIVMSRYLDIYRQALNCSA